MAKHDDPEYPHDNQKGSGSEVFLCFIFYHLIKYIFKTTLYLLYVYSCILLYCIICILYIKVAMHSLSHLFLLLILIKVGR